MTLACKDNSCKIHNHQKINNFDSHGNISIPVPEIVVLNLALAIKVVHWIHMLLNMSPILRNANEDVDPEEYDDQEYEYDDKESDFDDAEYDDKEMAEYIDELDNEEYLDDAYVYDDTELYIDEKKIDDQYLDDKSSNSVPNLESEHGNETTFSISIKQR